MTTWGSSELPWIAAAAAIGAASAAFTGSVYAGAAAALLAYLLRHVAPFRRLTRLLRENKRVEGPPPSGAWGPVFERVRGLQSRTRRRKRRLSRFVTRFQEAAAALPDPVVILRRDGKVAWHNPAAGRVLGFPETGAIGARIDDLLRDPGLLEYLEKAEFSRPLVMASPVNNALLLSVLVAPFGKRSQQVLVARDITRLYHVDRAQRDFVANVSHELRTPLTVLSGYLEAIDDAGPDATVDTKTISVMRKNVETMRHLITDLLSLARLEMAEVDREQSVDVSRLLGSLVMEAGVLAKKSRHDLRLETSPGARLRGNEAELRGTFSNLIQNALRHTPPRTVIQVQWQVSAQRARVSVTDNGAGIAARHVPRLTERFYQVDGSRSGSSGLGLAIVNHVLERHGAALVVESKPGKGTSFHCDFPPERVILAAEAS